MRKACLSLLAATLCASGAALAQATNPASLAPQSAPHPSAAQQPTTQQPTTQQPTAQQPLGFFAPQPGDDPSLFRTLPPEAYPQTPTDRQAAQPATTSASPPIVFVVPDANRDAREQMDRAELDAQLARSRMSREPAPINGAFTGLTDEADRH